MNRIKEVLEEKGIKQIWLADGIAELGGDVGKIRDLFVEFQQYLYKTA